MTTTRPELWTIADQEAAIQAREVPKTEAEIMIERAVGALLPHAAHNVLLPFDTPARWNESWMERGREPFGFGLWLNMDPQRETTMAISRTLPADERSGAWLWSCAATERTPETTESDFMVTSIGVTLAGAASVEQVRYKKVPESPDYYGYCVGGEFPGGMAQNRHQELVGHVGALLDTAMADIPAAQETYFDARNWDLPSRAFARLGSPVCQQALAPILAQYPVR
ncbi:MAG TPA: hypothetical protein VD735_04875 [Candidatus Saccharimonadales bacterium]|nr:hypothetical protein [Candidatus Saccharimonadales bacterium]